ncbi:MAG: phosphatase PAP2 family protein [Acidiferrobacterales bacterium]
MKAKHVITGFFIAATLTAFSYFFVDAGTAIFCHRLIVSNALLKEYASNIPDLLLPIVLVITTFCWTAYFTRVSRGIHNSHTRFLQLCGISLPLAYTVKAVLQHTFGRVDPKLWMFHQQLAGFHWFHGGSRYASFPSGHMTVFSALTAVFWNLYPRFRKVYLAGAVILGVALVATNYHFVSDVVAGAYLGLLVCYMSDLGLNAVSASYRAL